MVWLLVIVFVAGYLGIALEHRLGINKAATALLLGVSCWTIYVLGADSFLPIDQIPEWFAERTEAIGEHLRLEYIIDKQLLVLTGDTAGILFFLMGAMTIVELVDANEGFTVITQRISTTSKVKLLWITAWLAFILSSVLDNLTTTIVMISLLRRLIADKKTRTLFAGMVVIAANAGGAWTVIGDVTTTMLWIKGKIEPIAVMQELCLASVACLLVPLIGLSFMIRGKLEVPENEPDLNEARISRLHRTIFLIIGVAGLLSVPIFKAVTHLPPFLGMMLSLSVLWVTSEIMHAESDEKTKSSTGVLAVLKRVDMSCVLFFLGILLAVGCLGASGLLQILAHWLDNAIGNQQLVAVIIGFVSAVVDNVPLVAAGIEMYTNPPNDSFWMMLAYCAGTGGSCLIIGSAAGVAAMGLEQIDFMWYVRNITPWATLGYLAGVGVYLLQQSLLG